MTAAVALAPLPAPAVAWPRPGGFAWLVRHELRLVLRDGNRAGRIGRILAVLLLMLVPALLGIGLALHWQAKPDVPVAAFGLVTACIAALLLLMLSGACVYVLRSFHDRGDLDLLLAAPIPPARVLAAKAVAVHASVAMPLLIVTAPFFIASALVGHPRWLGGMAMLLVTAVIASSLAFIIAGGLFRALGARRARTTIQIGGGLFAALVAILGQSPNFAPRAFDRLFDRLDRVPPPPFDWPAQAVFAAPLPLLAMAVFAAGCAAGSARLTAGIMADASPVLPVPEARSRPRRRFRAGLQRVLLDKELRLLWRDPELLSAVALQLAYMIPAFGLIFAGGATSPPRLVAACVLFCGLLASSLGWLTICGEDAPELIASAPVTETQVARVKLVAACLPPLVLVAVPVLVIAGSDPRAGVIAALLAVVAAVCAAAQQGWAGQPQRRKTFRFRQKGSLLLAVGEYIMAGAWSGAAALMVEGSPWAVAPAVLAALVLFVTWWRRGALSPGALKSGGRGR